MQCLVLALAMVALSATGAFALDVLKAFSSGSEKDSRMFFYEDIYRAVMEETRSDFGDYRIKMVEGLPSQNRDLVEVVAGRLINVAPHATRPEWEERTIPIRIPLLKGALGIRLFLIRRDMLDRFAAVTTLEELKRLKMGLGTQWTITRIMEDAGFTVETGASYDGLFGMLEHGRFDYFPRGMNEIFDEIRARKDECPDMVVEPTLAIKMPLPLFLFVSPECPELAKRIEVGLKRIMESGIYDEIFERNFGGCARKARMQDRRVFIVDNPSLTPATRAALF